MNNYRSRIFFTLTGGLFFLLLLGGAILFFSFIDPSLLKNKIVAQLDAQTGKQWHIDGDVHWTMAPQPGIRLKGVTLDRPFDFLPDSPIKIAKMDILVDWRTLFSDSPQLKSVRLHHATFSWVQTLSQSAVPVSVSGDISFDPAMQAFVIENIVITAENCRLMGQAAGRNIFQSPVLDAQFHAAECHLSKPFLGKLNNLRLDVHFAHAMTGVISVDNLAFDRIHFNQFRSSLSADQRSIRFSDIQAKMPSGTLQADLWIHNFQAVPHYDLRATLKDIELSDLTQSDVLQGHVDLTAQLNTSGVSSALLLKNLQGMIKLSADKGFLNKALLLQALKDANRFMKTSSQVPFSYLTATADIRDGLLMNHDLSFQAEGLDAAGMGTINLLDESLQYRLLIKTQVKMLRRSFGIDVPLKIEGKWSQPIVQMEPTHIVLK